MQSVDTTVAVLPDGTAISESLTLAQADASFNPPSERRIGWIDIGSGILVAQVFSQSVSGGDHLDMRAMARTAARPSAARVMAHDDIGTTVNSITINSLKGGTAADNNIQIKMSGLAARTLLDSSDQSDFLKLAATADLTVKRGTTGAVATGAVGAGPFTYGITINIGTGPKVPLFAIGSFIPGGTAPSVPSMAGSQNFAASSFQALLTNHGAAYPGGSTINLQWLAIY